MMDEGQQNKIIESGKDKIIDKIIKSKDILPNKGKMKCDFIFNENDKSVIIGIETIEICNFIVSTESDDDGGYRDIRANVVCNTKFYNADSGIYIESFNIEGKDHEYYESNEYIKGIIFSSSTWESLKNEAFKKVQPVVV
jgi:hypothetical protein